MLILVKRQPGIVKLEREQELSMLPVEMPIKDRVKTLRQQRQFEHGGGAGGSLMTSCAMMFGKQMPPQPSAIGGNHCFRSTVVKENRRRNRFPVEVVAFP